MTCDNNVTSSFEPEDVFAWVTPYPAATDPYYELGVTYEGIDYDATGQPNGVDTRQCLDNNNITIYTSDQIRQMGWEDRICSGNPDDIHISRTFVTRLRLFVRIKTMPPHGYVSSLSDYIVVQFDGKGGVNQMADAKNLKYHINGLQNITVLDCGATFSISLKSGDRLRRLQRARHCESADAYAHVFNTNHQSAGCPVLGRI